MSSSVDVLDNSEAYLHLSKQYVQFDVVHFDQYYDEVTQAFTFVHKQTGVMHIVRSVHIPDQPVFDWKQSVPITFIPLDTIVSIHYSPDFHFMAIQRSPFLVDLYDLTNSNHTSISVKRKTGGILYRGVFFSTLLNPKEKKNTSEETTSPTDFTSTIATFFNFSLKKNEPTYEGWTLILVTNFEVQNYYVTHIRHVYKLVKSISISCTKFRYIQKLNLLFTYIDSEKNTEIKAYLVLNNSILKLSSIITPKPFEKTQIFIMDLYNSVYILQYSVEQGLLFVTEFKDYLDPTHLFKSVKLPTTGQLINLSYDNLILFISPSTHSAFLVDVHQLSFITPLSPILLHYVTSSSDYSYTISGVSSPKTPNTTVSYTYTEQTLGLSIEEAFSKYIDGDYRGRRYDYFDNSATVSKCTEDQFPVGSRIISINSQPTNGLSFMQCSDMIQNASRPLSITVETSIPSTTDMDAYYPPEPLHNEPKELTEEEQQILNIYDTDTEYIFPHYIYNKYMGTLFHIFIDLHQLSFLIPSLYIYSFLSQRKHYDLLFIKTEFLSVLYRYIFKQNNSISLIFDELNDVYESAHYKEPEAVFNPLYLTTFTGITHIPLEYVTDPNGYAIINQCDMISYVFDPSLYPEESYIVLSIYLTDYYKSLVDHHIHPHPFLIELIIYLYLYLKLYPQLVNLLHYVDHQDIRNSTRLLLSIDKSTVSEDLYQSLITTALDSMKKDGNWRDLCMFYIKNYKITKACSVIINHPTSFDSGKQIWIRELFNNTLHLCIEEDDLTTMYQLYRLIRVWTPNTLKSNTSEGGNELSRILGELNPILSTEPYQYVRTLFGLKC